nr:hypothetical protein [Tanacetum cinerariifolium]
HSRSIFFSIYDFSNPLFKDNDDLTSSDDESLSEEDIPIEESKVYSNPLFDDDEINSDELEPHVESNFIESLSNHDTLIESSLKIDYLEEFLVNSLISIQNLRNPTLTLRKKSVLLRICYMIIQLHVENFISNFANELSNNEASDFDNPSFPRPPLEPPDANFEIDAEEEISVVMNTIDELECLEPRDEFDYDNYSSFMFVIYPKVFSFLLSAESEDTIFDPDISV